MGLNPDNLVAILCILHNLDSWQWCDFYHRLWRHPTLSNNEYYACKNAYFINSKLKYFSV
jgi:hypothetical protein